MKRYNFVVGIKMNIVAKMAGGYSKPIKMWKINCSDEIPPSMRCFKWLDVISSILEETKFNTLFFSRLS